MCSHNPITRSHFRQLHSDILLYGVYFRQLHSDIPFRNIYCSWQKHYLLTKNGKFHHQNWGKTSGVRLDSKWTRREIIARAKKGHESTLHTFAFDVINAIGNSRSHLYNCTNFITNGKKCIRSIYDHIFNYYFSYYSKAFPFNAALNTRESFFIIVSLENWMENSTGTP